MSVKDKFHADEKTYFDNASPGCYSTMSQLCRALLKYLKKRALADRFSKIILEEMQVTLSAADESVVDLQREDNALVGKYDKFCVSYMIGFQSKQVTLP